MHVTFPRLPDHQRAYALVERDDGVVYRLYGGVAGPRLPYHLMHLVAERELRIRDGMWAGVAASVIPHPSCLRADLLADLVVSVAALETMTQDKIRQLARVKLAGLPPAELAGADVDPVVIAAAARALQVEAARWARLRVGEELSYEWPGP